MAVMQTSLCGLSAYFDSMALGAYQPSDDLVEGKACSAVTEDTLRQPLVSTVCPSRSLNLHLVRTSARACRKYVYSGLFPVVRTVTVLLLST